MELHLVKQPNKSIKEGWWLPWQSTNLVLAWLKYNDIWCDEKHTKVEYNWVYHFYDLTIFPGGKRSVTDLRAAIEKLPHKIKRVDDVWRWEHAESGQNTQVWGLRIWIDPEAAPHESTPTAEENEKKQ